MTTESRTPATAPAVEATTDEKTAAVRRPIRTQPAATLLRRMVLVTGSAGDAAIEPGDMAVLDRTSIGRKTLTKLVERLAEAGATGLVLNDDVMSDLPLTEREALGEKLPLLVLGPEHASTRLLEAPAPPPIADSTEALRALLRGEPVNEMDAVVDLAAPTRAVVVVAHPDEFAPLPMAKLEELVAAEATAADPRSATIVVDGGVVALVRDYNGGEHVENMGRAIVHRARSALLLSQITVGIGRKYDGTDGLRRSYREAMWAAGASELMWGGDRVTTFRELGIYGFLQPAVGDPDSGDTEDVERMLDHDRKCGASLLPTVETFFDLGSVGGTASALFVHRNTVGYRLRAVKKITGLDVLGDPDARLYLEVQIRLARVRGLLPPRPPAPLPKAGEGADSEEAQDD